MNAGRDVLGLSRGCAAVFAQTGRRAATGPRMGLVGLMGSFQQDL
jgi:hypothetical protein